jgi:hypothetical protein
MYRRIIFVLVASLSLGIFARGQTSAFTYQGRLTESGTLANGTYDLQFKLYDALSGGNQLPVSSPITVTRSAVSVSGGVFTVQLDFGPAAFPGADRFLDIAVKHPADSSFTALSPRQQLTSNPYAIRSSNAATADVATNATQLGGVASGQYVLTTDPRMTDARSPLSGSDNYIQNSTNQQSASFNVAGNGVIGGNLGIGAIDAGSLLNITGGAIVRARINSTSNGGLLLALNDQPRWSIATVTGGDLQIFNDANSQLAFAVNGSTNVISGNGSGLANITSVRTRNSSLVGSLRWDLLSPRNFATGVGPSAAAFDGESIWIANHDDNNVTKLRAIDGALQGTFAVGTNPQGIAYDGANIWVANNGSSNVTKIRASDGSVQGTFAVGEHPYGVAFDGSSIWVAYSSNNNITKLRASDGASLGNFTVGSQPLAIAFDGSNVWVANFGSGSVTKLRASDGVVQGTFTVGSEPFSIAFDGANIWVANFGSNNVTRLRPNDGSLQGTFTVGSGPAAVAFDGANIWVANFSNNNLTKLRASDGAVLGTFAVGVQPQAVAFDGANIWVANNTSGNVTRIPVFP